MTSDPPTGPEEPVAQVQSRKAALTPAERLVSLLRYVLLPFAVIALVVGMIIVIPTLDGSSEAAEDQNLQARPSTSAGLAPSASSTSPSPTENPTESPAESPTENPDGSSVGVTTPPSPVASPTPSSSAPEKEAGVPASPSSSDGLAPTRITVAAAGIDVTVLPLIPTADELTSQSIVPPISDDGYWLTSYGAPGPESTDTTYIAGHSWEGRDAPFDLFSTDVEPGDAVVLDTMGGPLTYVVDSVTTHDKNSLKNSDIWDITPNRLVIISCFTEDPWGKNVVVTASPAS